QFRHFAYWLTGRGARGRYLWRGLPPGCVTGRASHFLLLILTALARPHLQGGRANAALTARQVSAPDSRCRRGPGRGRLDAGPAGLRTALRGTISRLGAALPNLNLVRHPAVHQPQLPRLAGLLWPP